MKKILTTCSLVVLLLASSFHFSKVYLNYIRTLGMGFSPAVNTLMKTDLAPTARKDIFQVVW